MAPLGLCRPEAAAHLAASRTFPQLHFRLHSNWYNTARSAVLSSTRPKLQRDTRYVKRSAVYGQCIKWSDFVQCNVLAFATTELGMKMQ